MWPCTFVHYRPYTIYSSYFVLQYHTVDFTCIEKFEDKEKWYNKNTRHIVFTLLLKSNPLYSAELKFILRLNLIMLSLSDILLLQKKPKKSCWNGKFWKKIWIIYLHKKENYLTTWRSNIYDLPKFTCLVKHFLCPYL